MFFRSGNKLHEFKGANAEELKQTIRNYAAVGVGGEELPKEGTEEGDLYEFIDVAGSHCLNEKKDHIWKNIFKKDDGSYLESDVDEQLLLTIAFRGAVKIHTIKLKAPEDGRGPSRIKLFVNQPNMDFSNADNLTPIQEISLGESDYKEGTSVIALKYVKFQNVNSLSFFVDKNIGGVDTSSITHLTILGNSTKKITKVEEVIK